MQFCAKDSNGQEKNRSNIKITNKLNQCKSNKQNKMNHLLNVKVHYR